MSYKISDYISEEKLKEYFKKIKGNSLSVGVDGISPKVFDASFDSQIEIIQRKVTNKTYDYSFYKEKLILKNSTSPPRVICIPTVRDKLLLKAVNNLLIDAFGDNLLLRNARYVTYDVKKCIASGKYSSFIKTDIKNFFPSIDHIILMSKLKEKISDQYTLTLIVQAISQTTKSLAKKYEKYSATQGLPLGLSISGTLAAIYMSALDEKYNNMSNFKYYRFVDDFLVLCKSEEIESIKDSLKEDVESLKLDIYDNAESSDKSCSGSIENDKIYFLGHLYKTGRITVRESSVNKIYKRINHLFVQCAKGKLSTDKFYEKLNNKISGCSIDDNRYGWLFFFSNIDDQTLLFKLDEFVKKCFLRYNINDDFQKVKKFSRAYYELIKYPKSNYIPKYSTNRFLEEYIFISFEDKIDMKNDYFDDIDEYYIASF